jgi:hypothetical protein
MKRPTWRTTVALGVAAMLGACADGTLAPMAANDPANPRAPEAPAVATPMLAPKMQPSAPPAEHPHVHDPKGAGSP